MEGEQGFRDRDAAVIDDLTQRQGIVLATGGGAILREENRRHLAERGVVIHLDSPIEKIIARTRRDTKRPLLQTGDPAKTLRELQRLRGPLYAQIADHRVITDNKARIGFPKILKSLSANTLQQKPNHDASPVE